MADSGVVEMTKERWESLTDKDRAMMKTLGINPQFNKTKKTSVGVKKVPFNPVTRQHQIENRNSAPIEYWVKNNLNCTCCSSLEVIPGKMVKPDPRNNYLAFVKEAIPAGEIFRMRKLVRITCPKCRERLGAMDKGVLVEMVMMLTDRNSRKVEANGVEN